MLILLNVLTFLCFSNSKRDITIRNSSCGKVMFSQVSVCLQGGVHGGGHAWQGGHAWWEGACMAGACIVGGHAQQRGVFVGMHSCIKRFFHSSKTPCLSTMQFIIF